MEPKHIKSESAISMVDLSQIKLALYESLYNGNGIMSIITVAEKYYNNPILVGDTSYNIIAISSLGENITYGLKLDDNRIYGLNFSKDKRYLDPVLIRFMKQHKVIEDMYRNTTAFCTTSDQTDNPWVFCAIRIQNIVVAHVGIHYSNTKPKEEDIELATVLAQVISIEMQKSDFFIKKTGLQYEYFLTDLLEGQFEDLETVHSRIQVLGKKISKYLCIITISCDNTLDNRIFNKKQMEQLQSIYPNGMSLVYEDNIVLLISQNTPIQFIDKKHADLIEFLSRNNLKASISQNFTNPMEAGIYYKQAAKTLRIGKIHYPKELFYYTSDLMFFNILHSCDLIELKSYFLYELNILQQYDTNYNTELTHTLKTFLKQNRNATKTAECLHIHRSTFFYRIKKIEKLLSISINDSKTLSICELSFSIQEYINNIHS